MLPLRAVTGRLAMAFALWASPLACSGSMETLPEDPDAAGAEVLETVDDAVAPEVSTEVPAPDVVTDPPRVDAGSDTPRFDAGSDIPRFDAVSDIPRFDVGSDTPRFDVVSDTPRFDVVSDTPRFDVVSDVGRSDSGTDVRSVDAAVAVDVRDAAVAVDVRDAAVAVDVRDCGTVAPVIHPESSLYGFHFIPTLGERAAVAPRPTWMGGEGGPRLWDVELIQGPGYGWYLFEGHCYVNTTCGAFQALAAARVDLVVRLDDGTGGFVVPTSPAGRAAWRTRLEGLFDDRFGGAIHRFSKVFVVGNEPNICIEAGGAPGCAPASASIDPGAYAAAYREARAVVRARSQGQAIALVAGPSGAGARGFGYLDETLAQLCGDEVDGIALHAYGGNDTDPDRDGTYGFSADLRRQLASIDRACGGRFRGTAVFVTEFSRGTRPVPDSDFVLRVYDFLQRWNLRTDVHPVVAATYFLGRGTDFALENITLDSPNDHRRARAAFQEAVARRWRAGAWPAAPTPPSGCTPCRCVTGVDNFCNYTAPGDRTGCPGWEPGGYCNPPPGGSVNWVRGYEDYQARCARP